MNSYCKKVKCYYCKNVRIYNIDPDNEKIICQVCCKIQTKFLWEYVEYDDFRKFYKIKEEQTY